MTRLRITVSSFMIVIAVIAVDLALLVLLRGPGPKAFRAVMPMADVLAVLLATTVGRLRHRGEAPLSHVMFLLVGGIALTFYVYLDTLRPDLVYKYSLNAIVRRGGGHPLVNVLLGWLAVSVLIVVPALFAGWAARGYWLKLTAHITPAGKLRM